MRLAVLFAVLAAVLPANLSAQDMPITQVLIDGEGWELVGEGYGFTEGPAVDAEGNVFFSDPKNHRIYRAGLDGKVTLFAENTEKTSGLMFGPDGRLYGCSRIGKRIAVWNQDGSSETVVEVDDCNDLVVASDGSIYFTDPSNQRIYYVSPARKKMVVAEGFTPNGIILWPKEGTLVVTDRTEPHLWTFRIETDGSLTSKDRYYMPLQLNRNKDRPGSDGMTVDDKNRLYVATNVGIQMFDPTGRLGGTILKPQRKFLSNIVFGGPELGYLYATCTDKIYRRKVKPRGVPYFHRAK
jgi:sugar lactone lactonase YvrE